MSLIVIVTLLVVFYPIFSKMLFSEDNEIQYHAAQDFLVIIKWLIPPVLIIVIMALLYHLIVTHRICGPLVNFTHTFTKLSEGGLTRKIFLRHGDYLKCECEKINNTIDTFSDNLYNTQSDCNKLIAALEDELANIEELDTRKKIEDTLKIIKERIQSITNELVSFKLTDNDQYTCSDINSKIDESGKK